MKRVLIISGLVTVAAVSHAQSRSSFQVPSTLTGVTITKNGPLNFTVALAGNASMFYKGKTQKIQDIFGFWLLDNNDDMKTTGNNFGAWRYHENYVGQGGIGGYKTNPNTGIKAGGSQTFAFKSIQGTNESFGLHVRLKDCDTLYIEVPCEPVPEPASMAALGLGFAAILRRRAKKA